MKEGVRSDEDARRSLPLLGEQPAERADAARNRQRILAAAARIRAERGSAAISLDEVAREAALGVGTVYRRFGDRSSLLIALLDDDERQFQGLFTAGPPPLGPGAPPDERIRAFLHALADHVLMHLDVALEADASSPGGRLRSAPYRVWQLHLTTLIAQAHPAADARYLADALLAPLTATVLSYQLTERGATVDSIKAGLDDLLKFCPGSQPVPRPAD